MEDSQEGLPLIGELGGVSVRVVPCRACVS